MGPQLPFLVVTGCVMLGVRHAEGSETKQCPKDSYKTEDGVCCDLCPAGTFKAEDCLTDGGIHKCIPCIQGKFYTDKPNNESACFDCTPCAEGEEIVQECRKEHNSICQCKEEYYRSNGQCVRNNDVALRGGLIAMAVITCIVIIISLWRCKTTARTWINLRQEKRAFTEEKRALSEDLKEMTLLREQDRALLSAEQERLKNYTDEERLRLRQYGRSLILDTNSAHDRLQISSDLRTATRSDVPQGRPHHPHRFEFYPQALCSESFSSGQHYWEVDVGTVRWCRVGVAYGTIPRRGRGAECGLGGSDVSWCLQKHGDIFAVLHGGVETSLSVPQPPRRVGVHVDCDAGLLSFYSADTMTLLHSFHQTFTQPLHPGLGVGRFWWVDVGASVRIVDLSGAS